MQINLSDEKDRFSRISHGAFSTDKLTLKTNALANRHWLACLSRKTELSSFLTVKISFEFTSYKTLNWL